MLSVTTDGFLSDVTEEEIAVCLAGVQVTVEASNDLDGEAFKRLQNERMLNLYLDRRPGKKILLKQFPAIRDQWEKGVDLFKFEKRLDVREGMPASDLLRRAFLRAYAHGELGLTKTYSYPALARWLTDLGYPTKVSEPRSAKSQKVVLGCVPRTEEVMALFERLQGEFVGAALEGGLAGVESVGR